MAKINITKTVVDYLESIGLKKVSSIPDDILEKWKRLQNVERENGRQDEVYSFLNRDLKTSLLAFGYSDYSLYLYCLKYLYYLDFEGSLIDVGCGNGILTCFIAKMNPDCKVLGIDRNKEAIEVAKQIKGLLGLDNISFENMGLDEVDDCFDNVISLRTVHENIGFLSSDIPYLDFDEQMDEYHKIYGSYGSRFSRVMNDGALLVSIERNGFNAGYLSYLESLSAAGLLIDEDSMESESIKEVNDEGKFQIINARKEDGDLDVMSLWLNHYDDIDDDKDLRSFVDYQLMIKNDGLIEGYKTIDDKGHICAKRCLYRIKDKDGFILFQANNDIHSLNEFDIRRLDEGRSLLRRTKQEDINNGYEVREYEV